MKKINDEKILALATENAIQKLDNKVEVTTYYSKLKAEEQLYVQYIAFASLSMERAVRVVHKRLLETIPTLSITPEQMLLEYRMNTNVQKALEEVIEIKDREYSVMIQNDGMLGRDVIRNMALNGSSEEIRLRAAETLLKTSNDDFKAKRAKQKAIVENTNITQNNTVIWKIEAAKEEDILSPEDYIDIEA